MRSAKPLDRDLVLLVALAAAKLALHVATNGQYGFHRDELATLSDARHLAWGYVAYPPLTPFVGRLALTLFGTSLTGFRFFAALAQCGVMVLAGLMARRLGGARSAIVIAALATALSPVSLSAGTLFQYVSFDCLWFVLMAYFVVRLVDSEDARWWLAIGAAIGLGAMTKYAVAFYVAGLAAGVFLTPLRAHLRGRWPYLGAALSLVIVAPNLWWQARHQFISFEFLTFIHARDIRIGRTADFWREQIEDNLFLLPLALLGLYALFRSPRFRVLGWMFVATLLLFGVAQGRGYYTGPLYPMLFAAGAAYLQQVVASRSVTVRRLAYAAMILLLLGSSAAIAVCLPIAPLGSRYWDFVNANNGDLREEIGWPELTREVARIWSTIPADERAHTGIYCGNYGEAGAIDLYGPAYGLPPVISGINSYWLRGPGNPPPSTLIVVGGQRERVEAYCTSAELVGHTPNPWHLENEEARDHPDIFLCRGLRESWETVWPKVRSFG